MTRVFLHTHPSPHAAGGSATEKTEQGASQEGAHVVEDRMPADPLMYNTKTVCRVGVWWGVCVQPGKVWGVCIYIEVNGGWYVRETRMVCVGP